MIVKPTELEASQVPGVILVHRVADDQWQAYVAGDTLPDTSPTLAQKQAQAWDNIKAERDRRKEEGGYSAAGKWYHSDVYSRTQQLGLVLMGASIPSGLQWKTMDGSFVTMTPTLAGQIFQAAAAQDIATFGAGETHRAAMLQAADPLAYDFSGGWPAIFTG